MSAIMWVFEHSLALPFFGIGVKTDLFQSCGHCWVFQICGHIECSTITASSFRIWSSSTRIPSPPLDLFIAMLSKAHLNLHSRMSGCRWVITPLWLSGQLKLSKYNPPVYSCHLFLLLLYYFLLMLFFIRFFFWCGQFLSLYWICKNVTAVFVLCFDILVVRHVET